jgi:hypothetical protein
MAGMKVTLDAALRARDVSRPSGAQEEQAELDWPAGRTVRRRPTRPRPDDRERRKPSDQLAERPEPQSSEPQSSEPQSSEPPEAPPGDLPVALITRRQRRRTRAGQPG